MLKNYFKIAIAVLMRRKFFTFISLFGISFTLTILIVLTAFVDHLVSSGYPETARDRSLYLSILRLKNTKEHGMRSGPFSFYFLDHYASKLTIPQSMAISSFYTSTNTYVNNKKLVIDIKYTNDAFWDVLQFQFLEGKPYTQQQIERAEQVAVITEETRKEYFGDQPAIGKFIEADNVKYKVQGVVKNVPITKIFSYADMYLPYTLSKMDQHDKSYNGNYTGIILARSPKDIPAIQKEYDQLVSKIPLPGKEFDQMVTKADSYVQTFTRNAIGKPGGSDSGLGMLYLAAGCFIFLFMLLPTLNLVNINISRIMERSSEIGVRKAFGASTKTLAVQFIVENLIITFLGGLIGVILAFFILQFINNNNLIPHADLRINLTVVICSIVACILFGLLSGVYPAWRMSRLQVVNALKASS